MNLLLSLILVGNVACKCQTRTLDALHGDWAKLAKLIRDIRVALLTTVDLDGHFHTRPVQTMQLEGHDTLWFFTDWSSPKVHEMHQDVRVALSYADPRRHVYVAVSGSSTLLRDSPRPSTLEHRAARVLSRRPGRPSLGIASR